MKTTIQFFQSLAGRIGISCLLLFSVNYKTSGSTPLVCPTLGNTSLFELNGQTEFCTGDSASYAVAFSAIPAGATFDFYWDSNLNAMADPGEYLHRIQPAPGIPSALYKLEIEASFIGGQILVVYKDSDCPLDSIIRVPPLATTIYDCGARIDDPCTCLNNATTTENGQFSETIVVTSMPGEVWEVLTAVGLYQSGSPVPATPADLILPGTLLNVGLNIYEYELEGVHVDSQGYSLTVSNGTDTLSISNRCHYPNPVINLFTDYCINHPVINLAVSAAPYTGTFTTTINGNPATQFNPAALGLGVHQVAFEYNANPINDTLPGCIQRDTIFVDVFPNYTGSLACTDINVSLLQEGYIKIVPDMILLGDYKCYSTFVVDIIGKDADTLFCEDVGQVFMVKVTDPIRNNSCWANVRPEDKSAPVFQCSDTTVFCGTDIFALPPDAFISVEDNCGVANVTLIAQGPLTLAACNPVYGASITRTYRATDQMGNSSTCSHTIFFGRPDIADIVGPPNVQLSCGPDLDLSPENLGFPNVNGMPITALCRYSVDYTDMPFITCEGNQTFNRMWTVVDVCGGGGVGFVQLVEIIDNVGPDITCPGNLVVNNTPGLCSAEYTIPTPVMTDNCASTSSLSLLVLVNGNPALPGSVVVLNGGINNIEYFGTDPCSNTSSCLQTVTVVDNEAPTATCNDLTIELDASGEAILDVAGLNNIYIDNCGVTGVLIAKMAVPLVFGPSVTYGCTEVGENMLVVQFMDAAGNVNNCMITVTVQDNLGPTVVFCPMDETVECDGSTPPVVDPVFDDNCPGGFTVDYTPVFVPDCPNTGVITRTWVATDQMNNTAVCTQVITIEDTQIPVLVCETDVVIELDENGQATVTEGQVVVSVTDACSNVALDFNPPTYDCGDLGLNTLIVTATDECLNSTGCAVNVTVEDNIAPVFQNCDPNANLMLSGLPDCDPDTFLDPVTYGITVSDNCDNLVSVGLGIFQPGSFENFCENVLTPNLASGVVEFSVTDAEGNMATCTFNLQVQNDVDPIFTTCVANTNVILDGSGQGTVIQSDVAVAAFPFDCTDIDNTLGVVPSRSLDFTCADALNSPVLVTFTASVCTGNTNTCVVSVNVIDNEIPSITCPADATVNCGDPYDISVTGNATIDDNCIGGLLLENSDNLPSNLNCGTIIRTFTVTDASSNTNTCTQSITIEDNELPVVICQEITVELDATGNATADLNNAIIIVTDNCTILDFTLVTPNPSFDCSHIGPNLFQINVEDNCGNVGACEFNIEVEDNIAPVITTCNDISINFNDAGSCDLNDVMTYVEANLGLLDIDATDNCATVFGTTLSLLPGTVPICTDPNFPGQATLHYQATIDDGNGNSDQCDFAIAVEYTSAPVFSLCPAVVNLMLDNNGVVVFDAATHVTASDPGLCALPVTYSPSNLIFTCDDVGIQPLAVTASICTGASAVCNLSVNITNPVVPVVICPGDINLNADVNCEAFLSPAQILALTPAVTFNCDATITITRADGMDLTDPFLVGTTIINIMVELQNNPPTMCVVMVTVADNTSPVFLNCEPISIQHSSLVSCSPTDPAIYNLQAMDGCDPNPIISFISFEDEKDFCDAPEEGLQLYTVVYEVEDISGNTAVCSLEVTVVNDIDPVFTLCQDASIMVNMAGMTSVNLSDVAVAAFNGACTMDFTLNLPPVLNFDCEDVGENNFTAIATLCDGRTASCDFTVTVGQTGEFSVNCPADVEIFCGTDLSAFYDTYLMNFMEMGACVEDTTITITENLNACGTGAITILFEGTAQNGEQVSCQSNVTVIIDPADDFEFADVDWPADYNSNCSDINPVLTGSPTIPSPQTCSNYDFDFEDLVISPDMNGCEVVQRTWTVTETCRNQSVMNTQTITRPIPGLPVQSGPPVFTMVVSEPGVCGANVTLAAVSGPACATDIVITNDFNGGGADASGFYPVGITTVTYTLNNSCGEEETYVIQVEVRDQISPLINCGSSASGLCSDDINDLIGMITYTVTELCPFTVDTLITPNLNACGVGTITVRFVATDQSQNTGTCERVITVGADPGFMFTPVDVMFPDDIDLACDGAATTDITGTPEVLISSGCAQFVISSDDDETTDPVTGCVTIERTWTVLEQCTNVSVVDVQIITIAAPGIELSGIATEYNVNAPPDACEAQVDIPLLLALGCAGGTTITNNSPFADINGEDASGIYPVGTTVFQFFASNNCGGMATIEVTVNVYDVTAPVFNCPDADPILCTADIAAYVSTLTINATDACGISSSQAIIFSPTINCGAEDMVIEFRVTDNNGIVGTCELILEFIPDFIEESDIDWPQDYVMSCADNTNPVTTGLVFFGPNCGDPEATFTDGPVTTDIDGCPVFTRFWTVTDPCQIDPGIPGSGIFTYEQQIYPTDYSEILSLVPNDRLEQYEADPFDCMAAVTLIFPLPNYCGSDIVVQNSYTPNGSDASGFYPVGLTVVNYTISNDCGLLFEEEVIISVEDLTSPIVTCSDLPASLPCTADIDAIVGAWVYVVEESCAHDTTILINRSGLNNCGVGTLNVTLEIVDIGNNGASCNRSIQITPGVQVFDPADIIWPAAIVNLDDCGADTSPEGLNSIPTLSEPYNCLNITFTFTDATPDPVIDINNCIEIERTWTATDMCNGVVVGNFVQLILVTNNFAPIIVVGKLTDFADNSAMNAVMVSLGDNRIAMNAMTNKLGRFNFSVPMHQEIVRIKPVNTYKRKNKVNAVDLNLLIQHLYGNIPLQAPWRHVAADVDKSGSLTDNDLFLIRAMILGEIKQFETGNWKFLPTNLTDLNLDPVSWMNSPEFIDLTLSTVLPMHNNDFKAVELGKLYVQTISQTRDRNALPEHQWKVFDQALTEGIRTEIPVFAENSSKLKAFQYTLVWNKEEMKLVEILPGKGMNKDNFSLKHAEDGRITVCWGGESTVLSEADPVFTLVVVPKLNSDLKSSSLLISEEITEALSYFGTDNIQVPVLNIVTQGAEEGRDYALFQNSPNPFVKETWITYRIPADEMVTITVTDLQGKLISQQKQYCLKGKHASKLEFDRVLPDGVYLYRIETESFSATKKMLKIGE